MKWSDNVLYLDNHLLIAVKPAGLLTQPDDTGASSFQEELKQWVKEREHKPGNVFLHPIHRLDRQTSGLVIFAKSSKALSRLNEKMREGTIERVYGAEVEGRLDAEEGRLDHYLVHDDHIARLAKEGDKDAKKAR
ncbi:MAG TPA: RNA pseudouridine synthase, partial [Chlamydiales bacterium]|nr:RNA pseudouridine synthase [Chlamydiales bacterium]